MRTLILLRHGKSDYPGGTADHDRPLAARGVAEAELAGRWLVEKDLRPGLILSSSARRAQETAAAVLSAGLDAPVQIRPGIYDAAPDQILAEIVTVDPAVAILLVVGHAPGLPGLAVNLAGPGSRSRAVRTAAESFTTSTLAVLEVTAAWADLAEGGARLVEVHAARA